MTDRHSSPNNRSRVDQSGYLPWQNMSGEEVPAFAVIQLKTNFDGTSKATKPDESSGLFYTSGPVPVPATKFGESLLWHKPQRVLIDGTATVGDEVGPVEDQWYMSTEGSGFRVLRQPTEGVGIVERVGGGGGGGDTMWFDITEVVCADDYNPESHLLVEWTYYSGGCGTPPGANYDGTYSVYDMCGYMGIPENLTATKGRATYMYPRDGYCEPRWIIDDLCYEPGCV